MVVLDHFKSSAGSDSQYNPSLSWILHIMWRDLSEERVGVQCCAEKGIGGPSQHDDKAF